MNNKEKRKRVYVTGYGWCRYVGEKANPVTMLNYAPIDDNTRLALALLNKGEKYDALKAHCDKLYDNIIDMWHESKSDEPLHKLLDMTKDEYTRFVKGD